MIQLLLIPHSHVHQGSKNISFAITMPWAPAAVKELKEAMKAQPWTANERSWVKKMEAPSEDSTFEGPVYIKKDPV